MEGNTLDDFEMYLMGIENKEDTLFRKLICAQDLKKYKNYETD